MALKGAPKGAFRAEHGQRIFIYAHARTNQVVYSLTRALDNNKALGQLPFLGKQTQPAVLRKDLWRPLATVQFPSGTQGLSAYQQLREFRKRHEHEWDLEPIRQMSKVKRGRLLRDQKANSIADLAAVLGKQALTAEEHAKDADVKSEAEGRLLSQASNLRVRKAEAEKAYRTNPTDETRAEFTKCKRDYMKVKTVLKNPEESKLFTAVRTLQSADGLELSSALQQRLSKPTPATTMEGVKIQWASLQDAEFARTWPSAVVHDALGRGGIRSRHVHAPQVSIDAKGAAPAEAKSLAPLHPVRSPETTETNEPRPQTTLLTSLVKRLQFGRI